MTWLLLTSAGLHNPTLASALLDLAGAPAKDLDLAYIPTAANVEPGDKWWLIDDYARLRTQGYRSVDIVDVSALPRDLWQGRLEAAQVLVVGGGNPFHLMYWLRRSGLSELLPGWLAAKVYVGISAGSMVASRRVVSLAPRHYSAEIGERDDAGLGLVPFHVFPHLNSPHFPSYRRPLMEELATRAGAAIYAIDDETAVRRRIKPRVAASTRAGPCPGQGRGTRPQGRRRPRQPTARQPTRG